MRPIDADQLLDFIKFDERVIAPEEHTAQDIVMMIQTAPTITPPPNAPLTLDELREMDGEPVWCKDCSHYGTISVDTKGIWKGIPLFSFRHQGVNFCWNVDDRNLTLYRRKPEEGTI